MEELPVLFEEFDACDKVGSIGPTVTFVVFKGLDLFAIKKPYKK